jgi:hypothetical protein
VFLLVLLLQESRSQDQLQLSQQLPQALHQQMM